MLDNNDNCPSCGKSWKSTKIPKKSAHMYGGKPDENGDKWFSSLIGIYSMEQDRTTHYQCPFCDWTSNGAPPMPIKPRNAEGYRLL